MFIKEKNWEQNRKILTNKNNNTTEIIWKGKKKLIQTYRAACNSLNCSFKLSYWEILVTKEINFHKNEKKMGEVGLGKRNSS